MKCKASSICIPNSWQELLSKHFGHAPRKEAMIKFSSLAARLISLAPNGVLAHTIVTAGIEQITLLQPHLVAKLKKPGDFALELSRALRTLLSWFRDFKEGGRKKAALIRKAQAGEEGILEKTVENMMLKNKVTWDKGICKNSPNQCPFSCVA